MQLRFHIGNGKGKPGGRGRAVKGIREGRFNTMLRAEPGPGHAAVRAHGRAAHPDGIGRSKIKGQRFPCRNIPYLEIPVKPPPIRITQVRAEVKGIPFHPFNKDVAAGKIRINGKWGAADSRHTTRTENNKNYAQIPQAPRSLGH